MGTLFTAMNGLLACAVCVGNPDHAVTHGMNLAIGFLLVIVGGVLGSFLGFIAYLAKKERQAKELELSGAFDYAEEDQLV